MIRVFEDPSVPDGEFRLVGATTTTWRLHPRVGRVLRVPVYPQEHLTVRLPFPRGER